MRSIPKGAILADLRKDAEEKRKRLKLHFKEVYDKTKVYQFPKQVDMNRHFYIPKEFTRLEGLTKPALAVYPVLCSLADFEENKWFHVSRETLAKIAGITPTTVDRGILSLMDCRFNFGPALRREYWTEGKRHFYNYQVSFIRKPMMEDYRGEYFIFYSCIVTSSVWARLSPRAKALYLVMRSVAKFDYGAYIYDQDYEWTYDEDEIRNAYGEGYKDREWDVCSVSLAELCRWIKIDPSHTGNVINELEQYRLIERIDYSLYKVYLKPSRKSSEVEEDSLIAYDHSKF